MPQATIEPFQVIRNEVPAALDLLQRTLARPYPPSHREWAGHVWYALARLETKLASHIADGRSLDGIQALIDPSNATLVRQWDEVVRTFRDLLETVIALKWELYHRAQTTPAAAQRPSPFGDSAQELPIPRQRLEHLLDALHENLKAETRLLMDSITTDIGVGD